VLATHDHGRCLLVTYEVYRMDGLDSPPSSLTSAMEHVLASSQRVLADRIDLLRLEASEDVPTPSAQGYW
jgi:hypothetical protein